MSSTEAQTIETEIVWVTLGPAAAALKLSESTVRNMRIANKIPWKVRQGAGTEFSHYLYGVEKSLVDAIVATK